jgi:hypothetical protein
MQLRIAFLLATQHDRVVVPVKPLVPAWAGRTVQVIQQVAIDFFAQSSAEVLEH